MHKNITLAIILGLSVACFGAAPAKAADLVASHTDPAWKDGKGDVPEKGVCEHRGGKGMSPAIKIGAIPAGTVKLELHFTDEDYQGEGFHGVIGVKVASGQKEVSIPSFQGESDKIPAGYEAISSHGCSGCGGGVYLGPCSGGRGHAYNVYIYAKDAKGEKIAKGKLSLGNY